MKITGVRKEESKARETNGGLVKIIGKEKTIQRLLEKEEDIDWHKSQKGGLILNTDNAPSRQFVEHCYRTTSTMVNPIVDWTTAEVWEFLKYYGCESNPLYKEGFNRIGCVGCPMGGFCSMKREFTRYPKYKELYIKAFDRMLETRARKGLNKVWNSGEEVFDWWIGRDTKQISMFENEE